MPLPKIRTVEEGEINKHLKDHYKFGEKEMNPNFLFGLIDKIKFYGVSHPYKWLETDHRIEGIRMASLPDIGAMKVNAIVNSGTRLKDFVDLYALLEHQSMNQMLFAYIKKYPDRSMEIARMGVLHHGDINFNEKVDVIDRKLNWAEIAKRLKTAILEPD